MFSCTTEKYDLLYARWLDNPGDLLDLAGYVPGMHLLDLCGGTGAVTREALRRGADPDTLTLFDTKPRISIVGVHQVSGDASEIGEILKNRTYDVVVCRQAIGYLNIRGPVFEGVSKLLKPRSKFVFNSFIQPRWAWKKYEYLLHRYVEASCYFGKKVFHLQWCRGVGFDISVFQWHTKKDLLDSLAWKFNDVSIIKSSRGLRWTCTR